MHLDSFDLQHAPCGIFIFGEDLVLQAANQTLACMLCMSCADLTGMLLDHLLTPSDRLMFHMQVMPLLLVHRHVDEVPLNLVGSRGVEIAVLFHAARRERGSGTVTECIVTRMNERKRLEDELFKVKKATEQIPGMVYQYLLRADGTSCFPYASEGIRAVYALSPLQVQQSAERVFARIHPDDLALVAEGIATSAKALSPWHQKYRVNLPRRGMRWLEGYAMPGLRADGSVLWHGYISDVTDRKALEVARAAQMLSIQRAADNERLRSLFRQAPGFMCILRGPEHVFEFVNAAYVRLVGERELLGKPFRDALPEVAGQFFFEVLEQAFSNAMPFSARDVVVLLQRQADAPATQAYIDFVYQPMIEPDGSVSGIFVEGFDVTERRMAKLALQESEERLKEGMLVARMVVWDWELATGNVRFSDNSFALFGQHWNQVAAAWEAIHADDRQRLHRARNDAIATRSSYQEVVRFKRPDNGETIWVQIRGKIDFDEQGKPLAIRGVSIDVTERELAEQALHHSRSELRKLADHQERVREDERKRIARDIHDDLGQNLLALRIDVSMMAQLPNTVAVIAERIDMALQQIDTTIRAVRSIINDLRPVVLDLGLHAAVEWQAREFERRSGIFVELQIDHDEFALDDKQATALFRIVQESLTNITRHAQAQHVQIDMQRKDGGLCLTIADDGIGLAAGSAKKANTFGLVGIEERIHALGGKFRMSSKPGRGLAIMVSIPL